MDELDVILEDLENPVKSVNMDIWAWCPWCQVREWFVYVSGNRYRCNHCQNEREANIN